MAYSNNIKKAHDTPFWVPTNQLKTATSALASSASDKSSTGGRYIYYCTGALFYRYDTWNDIHTKLASPIITPTVGTSCKYSPDIGYCGNSLAAGLSSITIPGLNSDALVGLELEITSGNGYGQRRTIVSADPVVMLESGFVTGASVNYLQDITKKWEINQWIGCQVRVVYGTGTTQVRKVLYNDTNTIYLYDPTYQQLEVWNNNPFSTVAPYAAPVPTAGSQATFYIEQSTVYINTPWTNIPDDSSSFVIKGGGVFMFSSLATAPFGSLQYYDCLSDTWTPKTSIGGNIPALFGTDMALEIAAREVPYLSGAVTTAGTRTLFNSAANFDVDAWVNYNVIIRSGTGLGQSNRIVACSGNYIEIERPWITVPDATSIYDVSGDKYLLSLVGNGNSAMFKYDIARDQWFEGPLYDFGQTRNISVTYSGQEAYSAVINRYTGGILALSGAAPLSGGTGWAWGDLFSIGGNGAKGRVEAISATGIATSVSLYAAGSGYSVASGLSTLALSGSVGAGMTINVSSVGVVGRVFTSSNVNLYKGDIITVAGVAESTWNANYPVLAIDSLSSFDISAPSVSASAIPAFSQSATLIVDPTKNWVINEHTGKTVNLTISGTSPTCQVRRITSNTATTLTVASITPAVSGTSRYNIAGPEAFGHARQFRDSTENGEGRATSGTATTLVDTSKNWFVNKWAGYKVRILAGTGVGSEVTIISNSLTTLFLAAPGFTPDPTTKYLIMDTFGIGTGTFAATTMADSTKVWTPNMWAGRKVRFTAGTGYGVETLIGSNTSNTLTFASTTVPDATTCYTILGCAPKSTGIGMEWISGSTGGTWQPGRYSLTFRGGGSNAIDRYDVVKNKWDLSFFMTPQTEIFGTGSSYTYDGADTLYFTVSIVSDFVQVYALNVRTGSITGVGQTTALQGALHIGNIMESLASPDGGQFLYLMLDTSRLMYKTLVA